MRQFDEDYEIDAIEKCSRALSKVDDRTKIRVIRFLLDKYGLLAQTSPSDTTEKKDVVNQNFHYQQNNLVLVEPEKVQQLGNSNHNFSNGTVMSIKDVLIKGLTKSEPELMLIVAFYNSSFGSNTFTRKSILESLRENGIYTEQRSKSLSAYLTSLIKRSFLSTITDEELSITSEGVEQAKNILSGNSTTKKRKPKFKKAKSSKDSKSENDEVIADEDETTNNEIS